MTLLSYKNFRALSSHFQKKMKLSCFQKELFGFSMEKKKKAQIFKIYIVLVNFDYYVIFDFNIERKTVYFRKILAEYLTKEKNHGIVI